MLTSSHPYRVRVLPDDAEELVEPSNIGVTWWYILVKVLENGPVSDGEASDEGLVAQIDLLVKDWLQDVVVAAFVEGKCWACRGLGVVGGSEDGRDGLRDDGIGVYLRKLCLKDG